ncbi:MAG: hypothetical protein HOP21_06590 [Methylotenera sp.]|nr:hypothetical protein [Methylotenera sp.]
MALANSTARIRQKKRQRLIIVLILVLLAMGAGAYFYLAPDKKPKERVRPKGTLAVPRVSQPIRIGDRISFKQVDLDYLKPYEVPPDALMKSWQFNGRIATRNIRLGEYLHEEDLAPPGAPDGFSGMAKSGNRVVVVETGSIQGRLFLREGDHIDVLAINAPAAPPKSGGGVTREDGGSQPGAGGQPKKATVNTAVSTSATLVAEDAVVMLTPKKGPDTDYMVLQMKPEDAHITTLSLASGQKLRFVFRPFNDAQRITQPKKLTATTYPAKDSRLVEVIEGAKTTAQTPLLVE